MPPDRPWQNRGWREQAECWIKEELARLRHTPIVRMEQVRSSDDGVILRVDTAECVFYFKALADSHWIANEPVIADALGALYPHVVPKPLRIEASKRWMLTNQFGPTLEDAERDEEMLMAAVRAFGQIQVDSATQSMQFIEGDPFGVNLTRLSSTWETYAEEGRVLDSLEAQEVAALQKHAPLVKKLVRQLIESPIPQTLIHGDFGPHNIAQREGKPLIFDWTSVGVSFPFFDVVELLHRVRPREAGDDASIQTPKVDAIKDRLKSAYLEVWLGHAPMHELEKLWSVAEPLGFVSMALHLPFPYFPRRVLQYFEAT